MTAASPFDAADVPNREGNADYAITWPWRRGRLQQGMTAVLRVKNEARSLPWVLPALFRSTQAVVLVDNLSDDGTPDVAVSIARELGVSDRLVVRTYPFRVSRCGPEHLRTHPLSVHSLPYFYNWAFSQASTTYGMKWDGDMVLTADGEQLLGDMAWILPGQDAMLVMPRHPLYVADERLAYLDLGLSNLETYGYPMGDDYLHVKAFEWETRLSGAATRRVRLPDGVALELKWLDSDEFAHWTDTEAFGGRRTRRKAREHQIFTDLQQHRWQHHEGLHRIVAPAGRHVVEYVASDWLPRAARPFPVVP